MPFLDLPSPRTPHAAKFRSRRTAGSLSAAAIFAVVLAGCGAPGDPVPRHPVTPLPVTDLAARQQGDAVVLTFTLPHDSTDQDPLTAPLGVEIYRGPAPSGAASGAAPAAATPAVPRVPPPKQPPATLVDTIPSDVAKNYTQDQRFEFSDAVDPVSIANSPGAPVIYKVRTRVSARGLSADSNAVVVRLYPAPEEIRDLHATVTEQAVVLDWTPPQHTGTGAALAGVPAYRVYRAELMPVAAAPATGNPPGEKLRAPQQLLGPASATGYRDTMFEFGHTYIYSVRSTLPFGSDTVESADSNLLVVRPKDIFPPAAPQALVGVFVPAAPG